jgi:hypothetical protein
MDERTRERVRGILLSQWVDAFFLDEDSGRLLHAIESVMGRSLDDIKRFQNISLLSRRIEKARQGMSLQLARDVEREKIHGDAGSPMSREASNGRNLLNRPVVPIKESLT